MGLYCPVPMKRLLATSASLLLVACAGTGSDDPSLILSLGPLTVTVTLDTADPSPGLGAEIDGVGQGPGGGNTCGNILQVHGWRDNDKVVFRIEDQDDFCFATDIYEIRLANLSYQGRSSSIIIGNFVIAGGQVVPTDPAAVSRATMRFFPAGANAFDIQQYIVTQRTDGLAIIFEVPLSAFGFPASDVDDAIFNVTAQIERRTAPNQFDAIDTTVTVTVDFVDIP